MRHQGSQQQPRGACEQCACDVQAGLVSSGNSLDYTQQDLAFFNSNSVAVKEMESAAVAWVAAMFNTPMFALKSITDIVDGRLITRDAFPFKVIMNKLCVGSLPSLQDGTVCLASQYSLQNAADLHDTLLPGSIAFGQVLVQQPNLRGLQLT